MSSLIQPLVFIEHDSAGKEFHKTFAAGSVLNECLGAGSTWGEEQRVCEGIVATWAKRYKIQGRVFMLGGRPRAIERRYFDASYAERSEVGPTVISNGELARVVSDPKCVTVDGGRLAGRDDSLTAGADMLTLKMSCLVSPCRSCALSRRWCRGHCRTLALLWCLRCLVLPLICRMGLWLWSTC